MWDSKKKNSPPNNPPPHGFQNKVGEGQIPERKERRKGGKSNIGREKEREKERKRERRRSRFKEKDGSIRAKKKREEE